MIGKPHWFRYRIFGWGLAPKTWQGWVYVAVLAFLIGGTLAMGINDSTKMWIFAIIITVAVVDMILIMSSLPKVSDERENYHQLIIERNCSFAAIVALLAIALYQTYKNTGFMQSQGLPFDYSLLIILGAMFITKVISTLYVKTKM